MRLGFMALIDFRGVSLCFSGCWALEFSVLTATPTPPILQPDGHEIFVALVRHYVSAVHAGTFRLVEHDTDEEK